MHDHAEPLALGFRLRIGHRPRNGISRFQSGFARRGSSVSRSARQRILDSASTQLSDGTCFHQYQPLTKKGNADIGGGFNDDPLWLPLSVYAYLSETGDKTILGERCPYADKPDAASTLMDHLELSMNYTLRNRGPHGLPLIGHADWNDCLNLNCFSKTPGESFQCAATSPAAPPNRS